MLRSQRLALMQAARWCSVRSLRSSQRRGPDLHELWINATWFLIIWWWFVFFVFPNIARSSCSTASWHSHSVAGWPFADLQYASTTSRIDAIVRCQAKERFFPHQQHIEPLNSHEQIERVKIHITSYYPQNIVSQFSATISKCNALVRLDLGVAGTDALVKTPRFLADKVCVRRDTCTHFLKQLMMLSECCFFPTRADFLAGQRSDWWSWSTDTTGEERPSWRSIRLEWLCHDGLHIWILEIEQSQRDRWPFEPCGGQRDHKGIEQAPSFKRNEENDENVWPVLPSLCRVTVCHIDMVSHSSCQIVSNVVVPCCTHARQMTQTWPTWNRRDVGKCRKFARRSMQQKRTSCQACVGDDLHEALVWTSALEMQRKFFPRSDWKQFTAPASKETPHTPFMSIRGSLWDIFFLQV